MCVCVILFVLNAGWVRWDSAQYQLGRSWWKKSRNETPRWNGVEEIWNMRLSSSSSWRLSCISLISLVAKSVFILFLCVCVCVCVLLLAICDDLCYQMLTVFLPLTSLHSLLLSIFFDIVMMCCYLLSRWCHRLLVIAESCLQIFKSFKNLWLWMDGCP